MFSIIIYATFLFIPLTMEGINEFALCNLFSCIQLLLIFFSCSVFRRTFSLLFLHDMKQQCCAATNI